MPAFSSASRHAPLLTGVSQFEVDFVIPRLGIDVPVGIDPFLLYKSRDPVLANLHSRILSAFNTGVARVAAGDSEGARAIFDFPEPPELGFGYTARGREGSGVGPFRAELILETLRESPSLCQRGVRHIEEMQLFAVGIGPDRVSDIAANLMKSFLIAYTQRQAALWQIPVQSGAPLPHVFDFDDLSWFDGHFDLPVSPVDGAPMLLVPRRIVRALPWINYGDFLRTEFAAFHRAKRVSRRLNKHSSTPSGQIDKAAVVDLTRREVARVDRYIRRKEERANEAQPSNEYLDANERCPDAQRLKEELAALPSGRAAAERYQVLLLETLNYLFNPELIDGQLEVRTLDGTERRDIIFTNDSDSTFWSYIRAEHASLFLLFEAKNKDSLELADLNQTATYMGDRLGRLAFICTRHTPPESIVRKLFSIFNDSQPRKIIVVVADTDIVQMLEMKCHGRDPMLHIRKLYRDFRTSVQ